MSFSRLALFTSRNNTSLPGVDGPDQDKLLLFGGVIELSPVALTKTMAHGGPFGITIQRFMEDMTVFFCPFCFISLVLI